MLVDSHCHLDTAKFDQDRLDVMARARAAGVGLIVNPGIDLQHCRQAVKLARDHASVYATVGIHPNSSDEWSSRVAEQLTELASDPANKVVAYGEIGLDYYWDKVPKQVQRQAFEAQLELATRLQLPVVIHDRDAHADVEAMLAAWVNGSAFRNSGMKNLPFAGVLHAFGGELTLAEAAYDWNFVVSLGGPVTFQNAHRLHALMPQLRMDRLMLETDAPYLTPHPHRGKRNEPAHVRLVARQIAQLRGLSVKEVAATTTATALRFFGLEKQSATLSHAVAHVRENGIADVSPAESVKHG